MTNPTHVHVFEQAGLGKAPYKYLGVEKQHTGCQYCGTAIAFKFWLLSADGKRFFVGSDCILKSGDRGLARVIDADVKKHQKELRHERETALLDQFNQYLAAHPDFFGLTGPFAGQPHPFRWYADKGKTLGDYHRFLWDHSGQSKKAQLARKYLIMVGAALPTRKTGARPKKDVAPVAKRTQRTRHTAKPASIAVPLPDPEPVEPPRQQSFLFKKIR